jgi:uncharacterized Zn-finger protein
MILYFKFNEDKNGIDFSSNIEHAKKSLAKVMDHHIEKLSSLLNANEHQQNMTNISEIPIQHDNAIIEASDNSCSSTFKVERLLMPKSKTNSSSKKHKCKKRFQTSTQLNIHNQIHSKQKPFACDQCQKSFSLKGGLTIHKRVHTGEKPFSCSICQKEFAQSGDLTKHLRIHT